MNVSRRRLKGKDDDDEKAQGTAAVADGMKAAAARGRRRQ